MTISIILLIIQSRTSRKLLFTFISGLLLLYALTSLDHFVFVIIKIDTITLNIYLINFKANLLILLFKIFIQPDILFNTFMLCYLD